MNLSKYFPLFIILVVGIVYLYFRIRRIQEERQIDAQTDYDNVDLCEFSRKMDNGETWLFFKYEVTQPNKKNYILNKDGRYSQGKEWTNKYGYSYIISEVLDEEYYDTIYDSDGREISKNGPYIVYKIVSTVDKKYGDTIYGPVQKNYGGTNTQDNSNSNYYNQINCYKSEMVNHGISEQDINYILEKPNDKSAQRYFLEKYESVLRLIEVASAGISLLEFLRKIFFGG